MEAKALRGWTTLREDTKPRLSKAQTSLNRKGGSEDRGGETKIRTRTRMGKRVRKMGLMKTWNKLFIPFSSNLGCHPT